MREIEELARQRIQKLATDFDLQYHADQFRFLRVTARDKVLLDYLYGCPTEPYNTYGQTRAERIPRFADFLSDPALEVKVDSLGAAGSVLDSGIKSQFPDDPYDMPAAARDLLEDLTERAESAATPGLGMIITMHWTATDDPQKIGFLLLHEWCHVLAFANQLKFQSHDPEFWLRDEGLATLWEVGFRFPDNPRKALEQVLKSTRERGAPREVTGYYEEALILMDRLADCRTPGERRQRLLAEIGAESRA